MANEYIKLQGNVDGLVGVWGVDVTNELLSLLMPIDDKLTPKQVSAFTLRLICKIYEIDYDSLISEKRKTDVRKEAIMLNMLVIKSMYNCSSYTLGNIHDCSNKHAWELVKQGKAKLSEDSIFDNRYKIIKSRLNQLIKAVKK